MFLSIIIDILINQNLYIVSFLSTLEIVKSNKNPNHRNFDIKFNKWPQIIKLMFLNFIFYIIHFLFFPLHIFKFLNFRFFRKKLFWFWYFKIFRTLWNFCFRLKFIHRLNLIKHIIMLSFLFRNLVQFNLCFVFPLNHKTILI